MRILSVGQMDGISNTCRFRNLALKSIADKVDVVNTSAKGTLWYRIAYHLFLYGIPVKLPDTAGANRKIIELINKYNYDIVWIDKGNTIEASTLKAIRNKQSKTKLISYSPDNMSLRHNYSKQFSDGLQYYDVHLTVYRPRLKEALKMMGARDVIFVNKGFDPTFHHPYNLNFDEKKRLGGDIGFVGAWEQYRCDSILYLVDHGLKVKVWGDGGWLQYKGYSPNLIITGKGLYSEDYAKTFSAFKISLCFLRRKNCDKYTSRTYEIPACGGFMLAERTEEHLALFDEDKEAVFFSSNEELLEKCRYYLAHDDERKRIALAGRQRSIESDYSNEGMIRKVLRSICEN